MLKITSIIKKENKRYAENILDELDELSFPCYFLFITSGLQGIFGFLFLSISHATFGFLTTIVYLFSQTLTLFFFVGTNTNIRDYSEKKPMAIPLFKQAKKIKIVCAVISGSIKIDRVKKRFG